MTIRFKDYQGTTVRLAVWWPVEGNYQDATPDDMARAYHAMTDAQALEMARAYTRLPKDAKRLTRSFDDSLAPEVTRLETDLAELRRLGREVVEQARVEVPGGELTREMAALAKALEVKT